MRRIAATDLSAAIRRAFAAQGLSEGHAVLVADTLVSTSLDGIDTHGIRLVETYLRELAGGRSLAHTQFAISGDLPAVARFDAGHALGVVAGNVAMRLAIERARTFGVSAVAVRNSNHYGAAGYYANLAAREGQIGFSFSNSDALVSPWNGSQALNGTNPIAMSAPGVGDDMFCLDMATSQVSYSRVMQYLADGEALPAGWAKDAGGADAHASGQVHSLHAVGGYKGQGLGTMVQILASVLNAMPFDAALSHLYAEPYDRPRQVGHCFICLDLRAFGDVDAMRRRTTELLDDFRRSASAGGEPVLVAGDRERQCRRDRLLRGIPVSADEWRVLAPFLPDPKPSPRPIPQLETAQDPTP